MGGFTLVELLVSIALMLILTGTVVYIFINAQNIYIATDAKVQVYQNARYTLDFMERDIANTVKSADMEFFFDIGDHGKGHFGPNPSERFASQFGEYDYAATFRQPREYTGPDGRAHRRDSLYFKTSTTLAGQTKAALVEYFIAETDKNVAVGTTTQQERLVLKRSMWYISGVDSASGKPKFSQDVQDLCLYVTDMEIEIYYKNKREDRPGRYYSIKDAVQGRRPDSPRLRDMDPSPHGYAVSGFYSHVEPRAGYGIVSKAENGRFYTTARFDFPMLEPGDLIYVMPLRHGLPPGIRFDPKDCRIKSVTPGRLDPSGTTKIEFVEPYDLTGISRDLRAEWRAGWLPPAIKITIRIKDAKSQQIRSVSRVFKLLRS
jgi:hypothetical protein